MKCELLVGSHFYPQSFSSFFFFFLPEKSRPLSPHGDAKKPALAPDDLRGVVSSLGRPVLSQSYPVSPRDMSKIGHDQHLLHFNGESSAAARLPVAQNRPASVSHRSPTAPPLSFPAYQPAGHGSMPQDAGRLAAVRPLAMPEPPPLISSNKPGGSITQVRPHPPTLPAIFITPKISNSSAPPIPLSRELRFTPARPTGWTTGRWRPRRSLGWTSGKWVSTSASRV